VQLSVEVAGGGEVVPERLLDHDPGGFGQPGRVQAPYDLAKQRRRDLEVEDRLPGTSERLGDAAVGGVVRVIAGDVSEPAEQPIKDGRVDVVDSRLDRGPGVVAQAVVGPVVPRDADDATGHLPASLHPVQRLEGHLAGEVAADPEDDEFVRARGHRRGSLNAPVGGHPDDRSSAHSALGSRACSSAWSASDAWAPTSCGA